MSSNYKPFLMTFPKLVILILSSEKNTCNTYTLRMYIETFTNDVTMDCLWDFPIKGPFK